MPWPSPLSPSLEDLTSSATAVGLPEAVRAEPLPPTLLGQAHRVTVSREGVEQTFLARFSHPHTAPYSRTLVAIQMANTRGIPLPPGFATDPRPDMPIQIAWEVPLTQKTGGVWLRESPELHGSLGFALGKLLGALAPPVGAAAARVASNEAWIHAPSVTDAVLAEHAQLREQAQACGLLNDPDLTALEETVRQLAPLLHVEAVSLVHGDLSPEHTCFARVGSQLMLKGVNGWGHACLGDALEDWAAVLMQPAVHPGPVVRGYGRNAASQLFQQPHASSRLRAYAALHTLRALVHAWQLPTTGAWLHWRSRAVEHARHNAALLRDASFLTQRVELGLKSSRAKKLSAPVLPDLQPRVRLRHATQALYRSAPEDQPAAAECLAGALLCLRLKSPGGLPAWVTYTDGGLSRLDNRSITIDPPSHHGSAASPEASAVVQWLLHEAHTALKEPLPPPPQIAFALDAETRSLALPAAVHALQSAGLQLGEALSSVAPTGAPLTPRILSALGRPPPEALGVALQRFATLS